MGTRRGSFRRPYRPRVEPLLIPGSNPPCWDWGDGIGPEWCGAASLPPRRPRFPRRLALVLFWGAVALCLLLGLACAASRGRQRAESSPPPNLPQNVNHSR